MNNNEPSLNQISDFQTEDKEKAKVVYFVIGFLAVVAGVIIAVKLTSSAPEYVGTKSEPGINVIKH